MFQKHTLENKLKSQTLKETLIFKIISLKKIINIKIHMAKNIENYVFWGLGGDRVTHAHGLGLKNDCSA